MDKYLSFIKDWNWSSVAIDRAHAVLLYGTILSYKPETVLELGIGSGFITQTIMHAIRYNGMGNLTSIDNWNDWQFKEPAHVKELREMGVNIIAPIEEEDFIKENKNKYDIIVVDANHHHGGEWADKVLLALNEDGFLFAHDVLHPNYPSLKKYEELANKLNYFNYTFHKNSRKDEYCWRGWLLIHKKNK